MTDMSTPPQKQVPSTLCAQCAALHITPEDFGPVHRSARDSRLGDWYLGDIYDQKSDCAFCHLLSRAINSLDNVDLLSRAMDAPDHQRLGRNKIDLRREWPEDFLTISWQFYSDDDKSCCTWRLEIESVTGRFAPKYIVPVCSSLVPSIQGYHGRLIPSRHTDISRIRQWIESCEDHHSSCSESLVSISATEPLRVIDVERLCITLIHPPSRYSTLSYSWGQRPFTTLRKENYEFFLQPNSVDDKSGLPKTILDAVHLMQNLGERYLWVDSLCIIQNDSEEWTKIASRMGMIYSEAAFTICAAHGSDAHAGLPGVSRTPRTFEQHTATTFGLQLLVSHDLVDQLDDQTWNTRAWTFQERVLSKRCLIFVGNRVVFQCRRSQWQEDHCNGDQAMINLGYIVNPMEVFTARAPRERDPWSPWSQYCHFVRWYSRRKLTFWRDRVVAFAGVASVVASRLSQETNPTMLQGIPTSHFNQALEWDIESKGRRYRTKVGETPSFSSWSWLGWDCGVVLYWGRISRTWIVWYRGFQGCHELISCPDSRPLEIDELVEITRRNALCLQDASEPMGDLNAYPSAPTHSAADDCLHFYTWSTFLRLGEHEPRSSQRNAPLWFALFNQSDQEVGGITLEEKYTETDGNHLFEFAFLAKNKKHPHSYTALMLVWIEDRGVHERAGLAFITTDSLDKASFAPGLRWKEFTLG